MFKKKYRILMGWKHSMGKRNPTKLIGGVIEGTGLLLPEPQIFMMFSYTWDITPSQTDLYLKHRDLICSRLDKLYDDGEIYAHRC